MATAKSALILPSTQVQDWTGNTPETRVLTTLAARMERDGWQVQYDLAVGTREERLNRVSHLILSSSIQRVIAISASGDFALQLLTTISLPEPIQAFLIGTFPQQVYDMTASNHEALLIFGANDRVVFAPEDFDENDSEGLAQLESMGPIHYAHDCAQMIRSKSGAARVNIVEGCDHFLEPDSSRSLANVIAELSNFMEAAELQNDGIRNFGKSSQQFAQSPVHANVTIASRVRAAAPSRASILDVGCGAGHWGKNLSREVDDLTLLDPSPEMLEQALEVVPKSKTLVASRAESIPLATESFDLVTTRLALHHFADWRASLREMIRVTKPGGVVAITDLAAPEGDHAYALHHQIEVLHDPSHVESVRNSEMRKFLEAEGLGVLDQAETHLEFPEGVAIETWCDFVGTSQENRSQIAQILKDLSPEELNDLGFVRTENQFKYLVKSQLIVARKGEAHANN